jgi:hypothetical protein
LPAPRRLGRPLRVALSRRVPPPATEPAPLARKHRRRARASGRRSVGCGTAPYGVYHAHAADPKPRRPTAHRTPVAALPRARTSKDHAEGPRPETDPGGAPASTAAGLYRVRRQASGRAPTGVARRAAGPGRDGSAELLPWPGRWFPWVLLVQVHAGTTNVVAVTGHLHGLPGRSHRGGRPCRVLRQPEPSDIIESDGV